METFQLFLDLWEDVKLFLSELSRYIIKSLHLSFLNFEEKKGVFVSALYKQRGRLSRKLIHTGMGIITALGVMVSPLISQDFSNKNVNPWETTTVPLVLSASIDDPNIDTQISSKVRDSIINHVVTEGENIKSIAIKFGVSVESIKWQNNLTSDKIKIGQTLQILPVTGVSHKVQKGDTVYSIAKKYNADSQAIADFPFNTFRNDETFELAIGQVIIVPDGEIITPSTNVASRIRQITPNAGTVVASGQFVWPTAGTISQRFAWYHPGIDIANRGLPPVLAADSGRVIASGWDGTGYGNMVLIDHGNGYKTRYGHMSKLYVITGQTVGRGSPIGQMGSTGRSTGPHLHFEIYQNGTRLNPLGFLK